MPTPNTPSPAPSDFEQKAQSQDQNTQEEFENAIKSLTEEQVADLEEKVQNKKLSLNEAERDLVQTAAEKMKEKAINEQLNGLQNRVERLLIILDKEKNPSAQEPQATTSPEPATPMDAMTEKMRSTDEKENPLGKAGVMVETFRRVLENMPPTVLLFMRDMFKDSEPNSFGRRAFEFLSSIGEPKEINGKLEKAFGKEKVKVDNDADRAALRALHAQYNGLPEGKPATFELFIDQKIQKLKESNPSAVSIAALQPVDLVITPEQKAKKDEEEKKIRESSETPEQKKKRYTVALADALNAAAPGSVSYDASKDTGDIATVIKKALSEDDNTGYKNFGLELSTDGDLEEADGGGYLFGVDYDILTDWSGEITNNPKMAIQTFLSIDASKWDSTNIKAAQSIRSIQEALMKNTTINDVIPQATAAPVSPPVAPAPAAPTPEAAAPTA